MSLWCSGCSTLLGPFDSLPGQGPRRALTSHVRKGAHAPGQAARFALDGHSART